MNADESKSGLHAKSGDSSAQPKLPNSLVVDQRGPVTLLKLSRPAKRNALDDATVAGIEVSDSFSGETASRVPHVHA